MRNVICTQKISRRHERGFNLIEMIVASAILGTVALSVASLFVMGRRNVYSGKEMTAAVSMATRVSEDLSGMTLPEIYSAFGVPITTTPMSGTVTIDSSGSKATLSDNT